MFKLVGKHSLEGARAPGTILLLEAHLNWGPFKYYCRGIFKLVGKN